MNKLNPDDVFEYVFGAKISIAVLIWFIFITFVITKTVAEISWRTKLVEQGVYHWTIDAKTGDREFVPIHPMIQMIEQENTVIK